MLVHRRILTPCRGGKFRKTIFPSVKDSLLPRLSRCRCGHFLVVVVVKVGYTAPDVPALVLIDAQLWSRRLMLRARFNVSTHSTTLTLVFGDVSETRQGDE